MARIHVPKKGTFTCNSSTAEEAVKYLRQVLDEPAHGNVLLSCGPQKLDPKQQLREFNADFVFANYSWLLSCEYLDRSQAFNLYHADFWVIGPATAGHSRDGCSYVELVATSAQMQRPLWRLSRRVKGGGVQIQPWGAEKPRGRWGIKC
eukprot:s2229_g2.t1